MIQNAALAHLISVIKTTTKKAQVCRINLFPNLRENFLTPIIRSPRSCNGHKNRRGLFHGKTKRNGDETHSGTLTYPGEGMGGGANGSGLQA